ncbi:MAG: LodA/GoxA family CTQ-dependent oxidase [Pseudomonadota bacterium]
MSYTSLRIHPAISIARVGNSEEYYLGPETMAGMDIPGQILTGGLPIKPGTESTTIMSTDVRDSSGRLKRQAARFRIFQYIFPDAAGAETYPTGQGEEVKIGCMVDGKKIKDIIWTVHLANKKANSWQGGAGVEPFQGGAIPPLRNPEFGKVVSDPIRFKKLVIDAGPRALSASAGGTVHFDNTTQACYGSLSKGAIASLPHYPSSFPASEGSASDLLLHSRAIKTLGAITSEVSGRLIVMGGYGLACGFDKDGNFSPTAPLKGDVNNNNWLDDTADGPVSAFLVFDDGSTKTVDGSAWVISADPSYAPQTTNVVTLWDDLYCTWLEKLKLQPSIYNNHYQTDYKVDFATEVYPIFRAASLQKWNTSLPARAISKHDQVGKITAGWDEFKIMNFIRDPNRDEADQSSSATMPLSLGDAGKSFLSPTTAQYFFLKQWSQGQYAAADDALTNQPLGLGEALDKTILFNCLGGRFSPGIEMSFIVRDINLYQQEWAKHSNGGPFRINARALDYSKASQDSPFLGVGYIPLRSESVEPGDLSKFMALPWHTDYNSCATHTPNPNPGGDVDMSVLKQDWKEGMPAFNTLLYSSWPAQRPVAVYTYEDVVANNGQLARPRFSVRGEGTAITNTIIEPATLTASASWEFSLGAEQVGRYQDRQQFLLNWHRIGVVMQGPAIVRDPGAPKICNDFYLEVASEFATDKSNLVEPWRNTVIDKLYPPEPEKTKS